jgi:hypothetical protein
MSCGCQHSGSGLSDLARFYGLRGLGEIPQQLPAIGGGSPFQFGYNVGYLGGQKLYEPEEIARVLEDQALSYDTRSYHVAGYLNPYLTIEGNAVTTWPSASDFGQAIYQAVVDAGYPIDYGSIQFRFEPYYGPGQTTPPPMVGTPYPTSGGGNGATPPPGKCEFSKMKIADYLACQLGVSASSAMAYGAIGALVGVILLTKALK